MYLDEGHSPKPLGHKDRGVILVESRLAAFPLSTNHSAVSRWFMRLGDQLCARATCLLTVVLCMFLALLFVPGANCRQDSTSPKTRLSVKGGPRIQETDVPSPDQERPIAPPVEVESNLVLLDVLVTDDNGTVLSGLKRDNFRILDNGKPQFITYFAPTEDPITIVLLVEYSGYFSYKAADWSSGFLNHLDGKDWVALVTYDLKPTIQVDFTRNKAEVQDALRSLSYPAFHEANLFDAIVETLDKLDHVAGKKAILLVTTGIDTFSKNTFDETMGRIKESNVTIFCIGVAESEFMMSEMRSSSPNIGYLQAKNQLQTLTDLTGGMAWFPRFDGEVPSLFRSVVGFLRSEYDLGFALASESRDGRYHKLVVEIIDPSGRPLRVTDGKGKRRKVVVYARQGYVAARESAKH